MWSLFDYASVSVVDAAAKPSSDFQLAEKARDKILQSSQLQLSPDQSSTRNSNNDLSKNAPSTDFPQLYDVQTSSAADSSLFDPESFSDLPEEWILDDWTLFGAPLSAYHSAFES
jgi:hypothetical protein